MSRFSEYLKTLVAESGESVSALARTAGLNRPNLQNIIGGSRKPARGDIEKLLPCLRASAEQRAQLMELLEGELLGADVAERRAYVRSLLERLERSFQATPVPPWTAPVPAAVSGDAALFSGDAAVYSALMGLLQEGAALGGALAVFPGFPEEWLRRCLSALCALEGQALEVIQLAEFWKAPQAAACTANLEILSSALPLLLNSQLHYALRYTYAAHIEPPHPHQLFPHCLLFPQAVFLLHRDGEQALVLREEEALRCWQTAFRAMWADAQPLLNTDFDALAIVQYYNEVDSHNHRLGFLEYQPCLVPYADPDILDQLFLPGIPQREGIIRTILSWAGHLQTLGYVCLFYEEGLRQFARDGVIIDLPQSFSRPADTCVRRTVLRRLYDDCAGGKLLRAVRPQRLRLPRDVVVAAREHVGAHFVLPVANSSQYCNVRMEETTITDAFLSFITAAAHSDLVYTQAETLEIIRQIQATL